jgi:hypothetical protein
VCACDGLHVSCAPVRFSLTAPVAPPKAAAVDAAPVTMSESVNDDGAVPAVVTVTPKQSSGSMRLFWVSFMPVLDQARARVRASR